MKGIRFFTRTHDKVWGDYGRRYLESMLDSGLAVRAIALDGGGIFAEDPAWRSVRHLFITPLPVDYLNVTCGFGYDFKQTWTDGVVNLAITGPHPRAMNGVEISAVNLFDHVWTPQKNWAHELLESRITATWIDPAAGLTWSMWVNQLERKKSE